MSDDPHDTLTPVPARPDSELADQLRTLGHGRFPALRPELAAALVPATVPTGHHRQLQMVRVDGEAMDFKIIAPAPAEPTNVFFQLEESRVQLGAGPGRGKIIPVVIIDCDPDRPKVEREFCWCPAGATITASHPLRHVGTYVTPTTPPQVIALYEKDLSAQPVVLPDGEEKP